MDIFVKTNTMNTSTAGLAHLDWHSWLPCHHLPTFSLPGALRNPVPTTPWFVLVTQGHDVHLHLSFTACELAPRFGDAPCDHHALLGATRRHPRNK